MYSNSCSNILQTCQMLFLNESNEILLPDYVNSTLKLFDLSGDIIKIIHVQGLHYPRTICRNNNNKQIIVSNFDNIIILNENFRLQRKILNDICDYMILDSVKSQDFLYCTNNASNKLKLFNMNSYEKIKEIEIDSPLHMAVNFNKIYVTSLTFFEYDEENLKQFKRVKSGSNCIFVLNKKSLKVLKVFKFDNWLCPHGLFVDENKILITTAFKLNLKNKEVSNFRYFILVNRHGEIIHEILLNDIQNFVDAILVEKKLIFCGCESKETKYRIYWFKEVKIE